MRLDETYIYSRLATQDGSGTIYTNHIARSKANYQVTPALSFRAILDYNGVLPNTALVCAWMRRTSIAVSQRKTDRAPSIRTTSHARRRTIRSRRHFPSELFSTTTASCRTPLSYAPG